MKGPQLKQKSTKEPIFNCQYFRSLHARLPTLKTSGLRGL